MLMNGNYPVSDGDNAILNNSASDNNNIEN